MKKLTLDEYVHNYYLEHKSDQLGIFFDALLNVYGFTPQEAQDLFLDSKYPDLIDDNDATVILGLSGLNLYNKIQWSDTHRDIDYDLYDKSRYFYKSEEYWAGWILAYYQDHTQRTFQEIFQHLPLETIIGYYYPYHEADVSKSYSIFDAYFQDEKTTGKEEERNDQ
ncbi:hypothetical protein [Faecalicoccus pleomorphus]|uniref:hypothetical protein n=1 Tax=Faecalicoccus pleomorphus TaxID=1323 RepID=UPI0029429C20|nr:hypothetical protein [Faecalicoccus pleomorphus]